jgi:DNA-binding transcriptional LysR family regulator
MRSLNLDQLRTLVTIAELGTFAAASQALHLAAPTVSLHVSELEARLGAALLERGGRRARPTAAGAALIERGRRLLQGADAAVQQVRRHAEGREGTVRLGTSTGVLVHLLPQVLESLAASHPGIDVEVSILGSIDAMGRLAARTLDIAIVALPQPPLADLWLRPWRRDPMMAFLPPRWEAPDVVTPAWLAGQPLIANDNATLMHRLTTSWFAQAGLSPRARIELNFTEAIKSLVAAGYGAAVLPLEQPLAEAQAARVQVRPLEPPLMRELGFAHRDPASLEPATQQVLQAVASLAHADDAGVPST